MGTWRSLGEVMEQDLAPEALEKQPPCLATGLDELDMALGGGLRPGLTVLGGSPGAGKSTLALQMAVHIQSPQTPVLYYSLEMSAARLASKVVSRRVFAAGVLEHGFPANRTAARRWAFSARELFSPEDVKRFDDTKTRRMDEARTGGRDLFIVDRPLSAEAIAADVRAFSAARPGTLPLIVVDYLQELPKPRDRTLSDRQVVEANLRTLTDLAHASDELPYGLPVLLISSLNRGGYKQAIQMDSFKETGGIEYAADVLLGLQFSACHDEKSFDIQREKDRFPRQVEVSVLKQRYGSSGATVELTYYAEYDYFAGRSRAPSGKDEGEDAASLPPDAVESPASVWEKMVQTSPSAYMGNAYAVNELRKGRVRPGEWVECPVMGQGRDAVITRFRLTAEVTGFDMCVADALYTLYRAGGKGFSLGGLLHALSGDDVQTATAQWKKALTESVGRLTAAGIEIDCAAESKARKRGSRTLEPTFSGPFLAAESAGKDRWRFIGTGTPLTLYRYAEQINQIVRFPQALLAIKNADGKKLLRDSEENIFIKRFLIQRIEIARRGASRYSMNSIRYLPRRGEGLFSDLRLDPAGDRETFRRRCRAAHEAVKTVLDHYKRIGCIRDWTPAGGQSGLFGPDVPEGVELRLPGGSAGT